MRDGGGVVRDTVKFGVAASGGAMFLREPMSLLPERSHGEHSGR